MYRIFLLTSIYKKKVLPNVKLRLVNELDLKRVEFEQGWSIMNPAFGMLFA